METSGARAEWRLSAMHLDTVHYPDWHPWAGEYGPVYAYLLENGERRVLVDTGIGPEHPLIDRLYEPERRDIVVELMKRGVAPDGLEAVVVSHLHFDHVGGASNFRGVPIYVQRAEWDAAQAPKYTVPEFLEFPGANFRMMDGDYELAPGLRVISTPGHTPGHQVVAVSTEAGLAVLAGQSIDLCAEMEELVATGEVRGWAEDEGQEQRTDSAKRLLEVGPSRVFFSHDHKVWAPG